MIGRLKIELINVAALVSWLFAKVCLIIVVFKIFSLIISFSNEAVTTAVVQQVKDECGLERSTSAILGFNFDKDRPDCDQAEKEKHLRPKVGLVPTYRRTIYAVAKEAGASSRQVVFSSPFSYVPPPPLKVGSLISVRYRILDQENAQQASLHEGYGRDLVWTASWLCLGIFFLWSWRVLECRVVRRDVRDLTRLQQILMRDAEDWQRLEPSRLAQKTTSRPART